MNDMDPIPLLSEIAVGTGVALNGSLNSATNKLVRSGTSISMDGE
jgi:hypothetical protein